MSICHSNIFNFLAEVGMVLLISYGLAINVWNTNFLIWPLFDLKLCTFKPLVLSDDISLAGFKEMRRLHRKSYSDCLTQNMKTKTNTAKDLLYNKKN